MGLLDAFRKKRINWAERLPFPEITKVVEGKRYSTLDSKLIARGLTFGFLTPPTYNWLFRTSRSNFFIASTWATDNHNPTPGIQGIDVQTAIKFFETLAFQEVSYSDAFPDQPVVDA
jgi:hypothetical protein